MTQPVSTTTVSKNKLANRKARKDLTDCEAMLGLTPEQVRAEHQAQRARILKHGLRRAA